MKTGKGTGNTEVCRRHDQPWVALVGNFANHLHRPGDTAACTEPTAASGSRCTKACLECHLYQQQPTGLIGLTFTCLSIVTYISPVSDSISVTLKISSPIAALISPSVIVCVDFVPLMNDS